MTRLFLTILLASFIFTGCLKGEDRLQPEDVTFQLEGYIDLEGASFSDGAAKEVALEESLKVLEERSQAVSSGLTSFEKGEEPGRFIVSADQDVDRKELAWLLTTPGMLDFRVVSDADTVKLEELIVRFRGEGQEPFDEEREEFVPELLKSLSPGTVPLFTAKGGNFMKRGALEEVMVVGDESLLGTGPELKKVKLFEQDHGFLMVSFSFADVHVNDWARVTRENIGKKIAIIFDNLILNAPVVMSEIPGGSCQITMGDTGEEEAKSFALLLRTRPLKYPVKIVEERAIGPSR